MRQQMVLVVRQLRGMSNVDRVTRENLPTRLSDTELAAAARRARFPYKTGTYFVTGHNLYYIVDFLEHELDPSFLIEDCHTNRKKWVQKSSLIRMKKEVISP